MYSLEELFNKAIDEEMKQDTGVACLSGAISKPCKELTSLEINMIKDSIHDTYNLARQAMMPYVMEIIKFLVDNGSDVNAQDSIKNTPLHLAVLIPQDITLEPLKYLIEKRADINAQDVNGNTPLFWAQSIGNNKAVDMLIKAGADKNIRNNDGALYNEVLGNMKRIYIDREGTIHQDSQFGTRHNL